MVSFIASTLASTRAFLPPPPCLYLLDDGLKGAEVHEGADPTRSPPSLLLASAVRSSVFEALGKPPHVSSRPIKVCQMPKIQLLVSFPFQSDFESPGAHRMSVLISVLFHFNNCFQGGIVEAEEVCISRVSRSDSSPTGDYSELIRAFLEKPRIVSTVRQLS